MGDDRVHSYGKCAKNRDGLIGLYGRANGKFVFKTYKKAFTRFYKVNIELPPAYYRMPNERRGNYNQT